MIRILRESIGILLLPVAAAFFWEMVLFLTATSEQWLLGPATAGFAVYVLVYVIFVRSKFSFVETLEHEFNHLVIGKLFLKDARELMANSNRSGYMDFYVNSNNFVIALAPYTIPLLSIPLLVARTFPLPEIVLMVLDFSIGVTLAFHFAGLVNEFHFGQSDLQRSGYVFSVSYTLLVNSIWLALTAAIVSDDLEAIGEYFSSAINTAGVFYQSVIDFFAGLLGF